MTIGRCFSLAGTVLLRTTRTTFRKLTKQQSLYLFQQQIFRYIYTRKKHKSVTPVFVQALKLENKDKLAVVDQNGKFSYNDILHHSKILSDELKRLNNEEHFKWKCVAFLCDNDVSYVVTKWAIWLAKGVAVPLCKSHPTSEWEYVISDSQCSMIVATTEYSSQIKPISDKLNLPFKVVKTSEYASHYDPAQNAWNNSVVEASNLIYAVNESYFKDKPCLIIYTSGTTGRPKGVVLTYGNLDCNINGMIEEWRWMSNDVILHVLPLHHVHGVVNALMVPLYCGATVVMMPKFNPSQVWERLVGNEVNLFMAVPTIYSKLIESYEKNNSIGTITTQYIKSACLEKIRLMVSGSAALPRTVMEKWKEITGHTLLERYGMTELGMVLTNPLKGERIPGAVGKPFPGITVAVGEKDIKDSNKYKILAVGSSKGTKVTSGVKDIQGELLVKGPNVFKEYWNKPEATVESFTVDGWFKTGDTVLYEDGVYKILGRTSVDIIKSGGYKISALDIERHLLEHPDIAECAVIGLPDLTWGQKIGAVIVTKSKERLDLNQLKAWCSDKLPSYQTPSVIQTVDKLQRNAMGKINKKDLLKTVFPHYTKSI